MSGLLVNVDVEDELLGAGAPIYLLSNAAGSTPFPGSKEKRHYSRHWTPVHLDFVSDLESSANRAQAAGASVESAIETHPWGRIARLADPFGSGFCPLQFSRGGYDEIAK